MNSQVSLLLLLLSGVASGDDALVAIIEKLSASAEQISASKDLTINVLLNNRTGDSKFISDLWRENQAIATFVDRSIFWQKLRILRESFKSAVNMFNVPNEKPNEFLEIFSKNVRNRVITKGQFC